ncbi:MAG: glycosyltransferase family 4 protein [Bacteroidales bacterium]|nr:glycosyltransferase family 4 protein [Bacteroidales bacterium]
MRIAVNTRLLQKNRYGGIEAFSYETLKRLARDHPEHEFIFIFDRKFDPEFIFADNIKPVVAGPRTVHPILWYLWFEKRIPRLLKKMNADIFFSPDGMIPLKTNIPCISVIHDINFCHRKHDLPRLKSLYYRKYFMQFARKAMRIVTVSEYSAVDIAETWNIDPHKIDVIHNGVSDEFKPPVTQNEINIKGHTVPRPYFLFVGNISPRKNISNLIIAYEKYRNNYKGSAGLVVAGGSLFNNRHIRKIYVKSAYRDDILFTGAQHKNTLVRLYSGALALVFIPWFEGFGLPIVEAMKCGTPVIASNTTSVPEITGDAAILVNPADTSNIAKAMAGIEKNAEMRDELIKKGINRAKEFDWDKTAGLLWQSITRITKQ